MTEELRIPPFNAEAEQSVLGGILIDDNAIDRIASLRPEHFYRNDHRMIFVEMRKLSSEGKQIDIVTLCESLGSRAEEVGGFQYIGQLAQNVPGSANIQRYAEIVIEKFTLRQLLAASNSIASIVDSHIPTIEKLNRAQELLMGISEKSSTKEPVHVRDVLFQATLAIEKRQTREIEGVMTGLHDIDQKLNGLKNGDLIIIAGRPSMGKSALGVQFAEQAAIDGKTALILSQEMTLGQIGDRLIASRGKISMGKITTGKMTDEDFQQATYALGKLNEVPLYIDDQGALTLYDVQAKARTMRRKHGLEILVLDYIQLMSGQGDNRNSEIEVISRGLKALAKELNIPIVVLAQLSRKCDDRHDKRPVLSDLRDSGAIEQDADVVMFVYRDEVYNPDSHYKGMAEILVRKNRQGEIGMVPLVFRGEYSRFDNFSGDIPAPKQPPKSRRGFDD